MVCSCGRPYLMMDGRMLQVIDSVETQQGGGGSLPSASSSRESTPGSGFSNDSSSLAGHEEEDETDAGALRQVQRCAAAG